jgi:uncharacterized membrane protein YdjX (TVP38/TMEM64 family)
MWLGAALLGLGLLAAGLRLGSAQGGLWAIWQQVAGFFANKEAVSRFVEQFGLWAPIVFMGVQIFQVLVVPIPGEATGVLGGFLFGTARGFVFSTIALTLGSILSFLVARWLGMPLVKRLVSPATYHKFDFMTRNSGHLATFACFLMPGFPKDYMCLLLGVSPLRFRTFVLLCTIGRMPGTLLLSLQGANVRNSNYLTLAIVFAALALVVGIAYFYRRQIEACIRQWAAGSASQSATIESCQIEKDRGYSQTK